MGTLTTRALNRALLARQLLLERTEMPVSEALEHLVGLQAQNPRDPYLSLWARLDAFDPERLSELLANRRAVRISLMRATIHLVTARDALAIRPVLQRWLERNLFKATPFGRQIEGIDLDALTAAGRELLEREPMMFTELGRRLSKRFSGYDPIALGYAVREYVPLVQVPPRGLWGESGRALHTPAEHWLGQRFGPEPDIRRLLDRYLRALALRPLPTSRRGRDCPSARCRSASGASSSTCPARRCPTATPRRPSASCPTTTTSCSRTPTAAGSCPRA